MHRVLAGAGIEYIFASKKRVMAGESSPHSRP